MKQTIDKDTANTELRDQVQGLQREIEELVDEKQKLNEQLESVVAK